LNVIKIRWRDMRQSANMVISIDASYVIATLTGGLTFHVPKDFHPP